MPRGQCGAAVLWLGLGWGWGSGLGCRERETWSARMKGLGNNGGSEIDRVGVRPWGAHVWHCSECRRITSTRQVYVRYFLPCETSAPRSRPRRRGARAVRTTARQSCRSPRRSVLVHSLHIMWAKLTGRGGGDGGGYRSAGGGDAGASAGGGRTGERLHCAGQHVHRHRRSGGGAQAEGGGGGGDRGGGGGDAGASAGGGRAGERLLCASLHLWRRLWGARSPAAGDAGGRADGRCRCHAGAPRHR